MTTTGTARHPGRAALPGLTRAKRPAHRPGAATRWVVLVAAALVVAIALAGVNSPPAAATAAPAVSGIVRVESPPQANTSQSPQTAIAECPAGKQILGGGGNVYGHPTQTHRLTLTRLEPDTSLNGGDRHGFIVTGAETEGGVNNNWWIVAYALCGNLPPGSGHHIEVGATGAPSTQSVQTTQAVCPSGQRALGGGARIHNSSNHEVGLQVARASATGDITRAQAHEDASGYQGSWSLTAYAVCANTPQGYEVKYGASEQTGSEAKKQALASCSLGKRLIGAGAAITNIAPGNVSLQRIMPSTSFASATAVENASLNTPWDLIVAQAICVDQ